jgi:HD-like signal output (HDOD) protein
LVRAGHAGGPCFVVFHMADSLPAEPLSAFVARARELYTLPAAAAKVLELTSSAQVDARAIKHCIENDPALTAKLLRVVNSSLFGLSRQVSDLNQALALLGVKPLKLLVLGFSLPKALFEGLESNTLAAYWRRTLTKAAAARAFSEAAFRHGGDEAFLAGLLQDLGQLALVQDLKEPYLAFLDRARREGGDLAARELAALGFDHAMFSARLLDHWGLPQVLVAGIAQRQEVEPILALPAELRRLVQSLHLAELAARARADGEPPALDELHAVSRRYTDLTAADIERVLASIEETVARLAEALDLELSEPADRDRLVAEAKSRRDALGRMVARELEQVAEETRLWVEAEQLRRASDAFLSPNLRATALPASQPSGDGSVGKQFLQGVQPSLAPRTAMPRNDSDLVGLVEAAVNECRRRRAPVTLLAAALDRERELALTVGPEGVRRAAQFLFANGKTLGESHNGAWEASDTSMGLVLEDCDRPQAVALGRQWVETVSQCAAARSEWFGRPFTMSVGAATLALPPRNFPAHELIEAAWRCLTGARASGGNTVKSIDIY